MRNEKQRLAVALLVSFGVVFASGLKPFLPDTLFGNAVFGLVLWTGFYPLVVHVGFPLTRYWLILATGLPIALAASLVAPEVPGRAGMTLGVILLSLIVVLWTRIAKRRST